MALLIGALNLGAARQTQAGPAAPEAVEAILPPSLTGFVEAPFPAASAVDRATVVLRLSIDKAGTVTGVAVVESAGTPFDDAAATAAL
ncbi:MAG: TonB family protein, partial [Nannocystaceae bacterium]|nr:TonB family protein [Nannocystaceae bacterium]